MTYKNIQAALEKKLATITPALATAYENVPFTPVQNTPYQRVNLLPNATQDRAISADVREYLGLFQVTLCYPVGTGRGAAQARADAIDAAFKPVQRLTEGTTKVEIVESAQVATGFVDGDRWTVPVTIRYRAFIVS